MSRCLILSKSAEIVNWTAIFHRVYGRDLQIARLTLNQQTEASIHGDLYLSILTNVQLRERATRSEPQIQPMLVI